MRAGDSGRPAEGEAARGRPKLRGRDPGCEEPLLLLVAACMCLSVCAHACLCVCVRETQGTPNARLKVQNQTI